MNIVLLHNPKSGRASGIPLGEELSRDLSRAGYTVRCFKADRALETRVLAKELCGAVALVIAGGDGTIHHALPVLEELGTAAPPLYHFPAGTENLFSREFGHQADVALLIRTLARRRVCMIDVARFGSVPFVLMASVGYDARVVRRVAAERTGGVSKLNYVQAGLREFVTFTPPRMDVEVDGRPFVQGETGLLVVANSRQYAARLNPAGAAVMDDGLLDVVLLPHSNRVGLVAWLAVAAGGGHMDRPAYRQVRGQHVRMKLDSPQPMQVDGEYAGEIPATGSEFRVLPRALRVLMI